MAENSESKEILPIRGNTLSTEEKFRFYNTLAGLIKALEGQYTTIDLRNESCVTGKITHIDSQMNVEMQDVVFYDAKGTERVFPNFFISQRNIRYVHIPKSVSATDLIDKQMQKMERKKAKKEHTWKKVRAKRYNAEIAQSLQSEEKAA